MVNPAIILVQRDARHYPRPLEFDPDRFAGRSPDPALWLPFGGGNRRCLGAAFASVEMRVVLGEILRRTELRTTTSRGERPKVRLVMVAPHKGARIAVRRRIPTVSPAGSPSAVSA
jgi:cytochrome P450